MKFRDMFNKSYETSDNNSEETLKSHYYRARYEEALKMVRELVEAEKATITDENEVYKEILFENNSYSCVCKITDTTPVEMAIDFKIETFGFFSFGKGKKIIAGFYKFLDSKLNFKGVGLFKEK